MLPAVSARSSTVYDRKHTGAAHRHSTAGEFLWRLVRQYSIPQEMLTQPSLHRAIVAELSGKSPAEIAVWFSARPANLARLVATHRNAAMAHELANLRMENHERAAGIQRLLADLKSAEQEISRHRSGLDDMTRDNLPQGCGHRGIEQAGVSAYPGKTDGSPAAAKKQIMIV